MTEIEVVSDAAQKPGALTASFAATPANVHTLSFSELVGLNTHVIDGFTEVLKDEMLGVPHAITGMTFWMPKRNQDGSLQRGFVSCECTIGDANMLEAALKRGWIPNKTSVDELLFSPNERVLYNDGSTGIRRQLVEILQNGKLLDVGGNGDRMRFDKPWTEWASFTQHTTQGTDKDGDDVIVPSFHETPEGNPLVIIVPRGLMKSSYSNDYTDDGVTYYLR